MAETDTIISQDGTYPIDLTQGSPFELELTYEHPEGNQWVATSLAGWSGRAQMRDSAGGALLLAFSVQVSQAPEGDENAGKVWVRATADATADVRRSGVWDCELYDGAGGEISLISLSPVNLKRQVTLP